MPEVLFIRADGSAEIGTGHVMRCLALAQAWQRAGGEAVFAMGETTPSLIRHVEGAGFRWVQLKAGQAGAEADASESIASAREFGTTRMVLDGYQFGAEFQERVKVAGLRLLVIDDYGHADFYHADFILNQNLQARAEMYPRRQPDAILLLGLSYVLLRQQFLEWSDWQRDFPSPARKLLVTLGGSDPDNVTGKVISSLHGRDDLDVVIVAGGSNPHLEALKAAAATLPAAQLVVDTPNMPKLMAWADLAITGAGSTCWEMAFLGLPMLALILAENQAPVAAVLEQHGLGINLGWHSGGGVDKIAASLKQLGNETEQRHAMSRAGRRLVDGKGSARVAEVMRPGAGPAKVSYSTSP